jgi:CDP-glycerol glycerophosphotransferase (TagB/SpsB family)
VLSGLVAPLSRLYGRDPDRWVFGAGLGTGFVDNSKYLFLHAADRSAVDAAWLSRDPETVATLREAGYEAHRVRSLRGVWLRFRAGVVVVTHGPYDVGGVAIGGATIVNVWHGIPLKTIGFDAEAREDPWIVRRARRALARRYDLVTVPSTMAVHQFHTGLGVPRDRIRVVGYPRHDPIVRSVEDADVGANEAVRDRLATAGEEGPVVLYLPTFRTRGADLADRVDFAALDRLLAATDARLFVKPHPFERCSTVADLEHVERLDGIEDVYPLLDEFDVLVTDYSSVFLDYLLLDRPIVFYAPDLDTYRADRGFYYDYETFVPGPIAADTAALVDHLADALAGDPYADRRRSLRDAFLATPADPTASRSAAVFDAVRNTLPD